MKDTQKLHEAVRKFLHHLSMINEHMCRVYSNGDNGRDLRQEEEYAEEWARKLVEMLPTNHLEDYETYSDSILEFQAARSCFDRLNNGEVPRGAELLNKVFGSEKRHLDLTNLNTELGDFAKGLGIEKEDAAAIKAYIKSGPPYDCVNDDVKAILQNVKQSGEVEN